MGLEDEEEEEEEDEEDRASACVLFRRGRDWRDRDCVNGWMRVCMAYRAVLFCPVLPCPALP
jgi:hypothetical protein